ncbi:MAG TPA: hypothetical protein DDY52_01000 [Candidatus Moranbacteria bacterium]|nr:MAG: hypothetical protein UR51_C0005G0010 [Candidatus Moranbacteria bacterium GW2011_GWF1_34_10]HBI16724.1 hypothetical protein [Candidatus Moranbacteria bacterium]
MYFFAEDRKKEEEEREVRVGSTGSTEISLKDLRPEEVRGIEGMVNGHSWVTVTDGRLEVINRKENLPGPSEDEELLPFWSRQKPGSHQLKLFDVAIPEYSHPSIIIRHLCGYNYSPEKYRLQAELLESYGFECLRSRRGCDGRFSEVWILPALWFAKGKLNEVLGETRSYSEKDMERVINFICMNVQFGTLDISFQRAAMPIPD